MKKLTKLFAIVALLRYQLLLTEEPSFGGNGYNGGYNNNWPPFNNGNDWGNDTDFGFNSNTKNSNKGNNTGKIDD